MHTKSQTYTGATTGRIAAFQKPGGFSPANHNRLAEVVLAQFVGRTCKYCGEAMRRPDLDDAKIASNPGDADHIAIAHDLCFEIAHT